MPSPVRDGKLIATTKKGGIMNLKTRLESVVWGGAGLAIGLTAWALTFGIPTPQVPYHTFEEPAAATVSQSPSLSPTPSLSPSATVSVKPRTLTHNVVVPQDVTTASTTEAPPETPTWTPTASYAVDGLNGDGTQGPQAPVVRPAGSPTPTAVNTPTSVPTEVIAQ